jgi:SSS family solute:Na+ symporter
MTSLEGLAVFAAYTFAVLFLTGPTFAFEENRSRFYLGNRRTGTWMSMATFVATWMSAASLLGYTVWLAQDGYVAMAGSVNGWLLGLAPMPFLVARIRSIRALSMPEWLGRRYGDPRLRTLAAAALLSAYTLYLVIQFRGFGSVVGQLLGIRHPVVAASLIYLFVVYTTFGGYPSVVRSDALNLGIIVLGVTVAGIAAVAPWGGPSGLHRALAARAPEALISWRSLPDGIEVGAMMLAWGLGVASNPQYAIRIQAARTPEAAWRMLALSTVLIGWIYLLLTLFGLAGRLAAPGGTPDFPTLAALTAPGPGALLLLLAVLAAAVSTANSQLLLAACSLCHDLGGLRRDSGGRGAAVRVHPPLEPSSGKPRFEPPSGGIRDPFREDRFLFLNRAAVVGIATAALALSLLPLPGILVLGRMSWTVVALCFFLPLYAPSRAKGRGLFLASSVALALHTLLISAGLSPEIALLFALPVEATLWGILARRSGSERTVDSAASAGKGAGS